MLALLDRALECAVRAKLPMRMCDVLRCRVLFMSAPLGDYARFSSLRPLVRDRILEQSGLADYDELSHIEQPEARLREAVQRARLRHVETPEPERSFSPEEACVWLAHLCGACAFMAAIAQELAFVADLPLTAAFVPFSTALLHVDRMLATQRELQIARETEAAEHATTMLRDIEGPAYAALTPEGRAHTRAGYCYLLGLLDAVLGKPSAIEYVKVLDKPYQRSNAWRVRMVYELMHGRSEAAALCQRRSELLALQDSGQMILPGTTVRSELLAAIYGDDLLGVKRCMERSEALAADYPRWRSTFGTARAHYRRLQGDTAAALVAAEEAIAMTPAARHINWGLAASTHVDVLNELGRTTEAIACGESYLAIAISERLGGVRTQLLRSLAECYVRSGRLADALRSAEEHLARQLEIGAQGLQLGLAYETRARVAIGMHDEAAVHHYAQLCAAEYKASRNALLSRKYKQLIHQADQAGVPIATAQLQAADFTVAASVSDPMQTLHSRLLGVTSHAERAEQALRLLLEAHGAAAGYLFGTLDGHLELLSSAAEEEPSFALVRSLEGWVVALSEHAELTSDSEEVAEATLLQSSAEAVGDDRTTFQSVEHGEEPGGRAGLDVNIDGFEVLPLITTRGTTRVLVALAALRFEAAGRRAVPTRVLSAFADALLSHEYA
jgi:hypothetical protein